MKHPPNTRRGRPRGNGKRFQQSRTQNFESSGADTKVRGTAQQVLDKYLALARDAGTAGDRVTSETYLQFAEHYYRVAHGDRPAGDGGSDRGHPPLKPEPGATTVSSLAEGPQPAVPQPEKAEAEEDADADAKSEAEAVSA